MTYIGISVYRHAVRNAGPLRGSDCLQLRAPTRRHEKRHSEVQNKSGRGELRAVFPTCASEKRPRMSKLKKSACVPSTARSTQSRYGRAERRKRRRLDGRRDQVGVERAAGVRSDDAGVSVVLKAVQLPRHRRGGSSPRPLTSGKRHKKAKQDCNKEAAARYAAQKPPDTRTLSHLDCARSVRERVRRRQRAPRRERFVAPCAGSVG